MAVNNHSVTGFPETTHVHNFTNDTQKIKQNVTKCGMVDKYVMLRSLQKTQIMNRLERYSYIF